MCGFAGEFVFAGRADSELAGSMAGALAHRGPDETGLYKSADGRCAIGFRRLAVIDLPNSHQPMTTPDGRFTLAFNGEIYNYRSLREELSGQGGAFRTSGDTEVLLQLLSTQGYAAVTKLRGMFAFAMYDAAAGTLLLGRDHLGQKPLWYARTADRIIFASEAKALLLHPAVDKSIDPQAIVEYLSFGCVGAPGSIWRAVRKVPPAHTLTCQGDTAAVERYWSPAVSPIVTTSTKDLVEQLRHQVLQAVREHLMADVPLGVLLSGGIDSAVVAAAMTQCVGRGGGIRTFTAGFADSEYDERPLARQVADRLGTDHTELLVAPPTAGLLREIVARYDEPFGDSSAVPTYLVCREARKHVKVALAGDGGDEVFGGYDRYRAVRMAEGMGTAGYMLFRTAAVLARPLASDDERSPLRRFLRFADSLPFPPAVRYLRYRSIFQPSEIARVLSPGFLAQADVDRTAERFCGLYEDGQGNDEVAMAQLHDLQAYLPDDLLVKTDIASMASSLELRAPLLDPRVVGFGLSLPQELRTHGRLGKVALRRAFSDVLPPEVVLGRKRGFAVPLAKWLREDLRDEVAAVLNDSRLEDTGVFSKRAIIGLMNDHMSGRFDHRHRLWSVLVLAWWLLGR